MHADTQFNFKLETCHLQDKFSNVLLKKNRSGIINFGFSNSLHFNYLLRLSVGWNNVVKLLSNLPLSKVYIYLFYFPPPLRLIYNLCLKREAKYFFFSVV